MNSKVILDTLAVSTKFVRYVFYSCQPIQSSCVDLFFLGLFNNVVSVQRLYGLERG